MKSSLSGNEILDILGDAPLNGCFAHTPVVPSFKVNGPVFLPGRSTVKHEIVVWPKPDHISCSSAVIFCGQLFTPESHLEFGGRRPTPTETEAFRLIVQKLDILVDEATEDGLDETQEWVPVPQGAYTAGLQELCERTGMELVFSPSYELIGTGFDVKLRFS